ncbi:ribonuclease H-like domain-containing protein [Tanacetum coccineum]
MSVHNSEHNSFNNSDHDDDIHDSVTRISKLDISDPLHLHPNDTTALTVVSIKLTGTENYQVWSCVMLLALEGKNKIGLIDGSCKRSNEYEVLGKQWDRNVSFIADYYHKLNALWKQYDAMIELPKCVCNAFEGFKKHNQLLKLMQFLMGLDDSYMQIRSSILSRETLPDVRSAYATISSEESHRVAVGSIAGSSQRNQVSAFVSNVPNSQNFREVIKILMLDLQDLIICFKIIGYPADFGKKKSGQNFKKQSVSNNNSVEKSSSSGFTDEQMATLISLIKDNKVGKNVQANMAGFESEKCLGDWLGHPADPVLNVLKDSLNNDKKDNTDSKVGKNDSTNVFQNVNHINFVDIEYPEIPNDDERVTNDLNKGKSDSSNSSVSGSTINTADFLVDFGNDADSSNDFVATQNEEVATLEENIFSEGNLDQNQSSSQGVQIVRRSSRQSVFPKNYNDFVVESKVKYGLEKYVGYSKLNFEIFCFVTQLNKTREPKNYFETSKYSHWIDVVNQEMDALLRNGTWELVDLPEGRKAIRRIDYEETFSPVVKMVTVRCLLNIIVSMSWPVFQLDVNNAFLYGDSEEWNAKLTSTLIENGFSQSKSDYFLYTKSDKGVFLALLVYVDDIIITGNSVYEIEKFKVFLKSKFMIKDLGKLKYFLGIEVVDTDKDYSSLTSHLKIAFKILRYLKSCPGLGVHVTKTSGMFLTAYSDADWAKCIVTRKSVTGYCVFLNNSLVYWKSKKQNTLSKSSTEAEYRALASVTSDVIWILNFLKDLQIKNLLSVSLHCDCYSAIKIAANLVFHERIKHLEIDLHFVREKVLEEVVKTVNVDSTNQIADILTKGLDTVQHLELVKNLGMYDVYQFSLIRSFSKRWIMDESLRTVAAKFAKI